MKTYKEEIVTKKVIHQTLCNFCGKPAVFLDKDGCYREWACEAKITWVNHGPFPGQQSGSGNFDICRQCYADKIKPLMVMPINESVYDDDSNTTTVKP